MNGDNPSRVTTFNGMVRSLITLAMAAAFIYGFVWQKSISGEVFTNLVVLTVTWWFSRDQASAASKESAELLKAPPPGAPTVEVTKETTP